jgi:pectinesterase
MKNLFKHMGNILLSAMLVAVMVAACKKDKELNSDTPSEESPAGLSITLNVDSLYVDIFQADQPAITGKVASVNGLQSVACYIVDDYDELLPVSTATEFENAKEYGINVELNYSVVMKGFRVVATDVEKNVATKTIPLQVVDLLRWEPEVVMLPLEDTLTLSIALADTLSVTVRATSDAGVERIAFYLVELRSGQQTESLAREFSFTPTPYKQESCTGTVTCTPYAVAVKVAVTNGKGHVKYVEKPVKITDRDVIAPQISIPSVNDTIKASLSLASKITLQVEVFSAAGLSNVRYYDHKANGDSVELKNSDVQGVKFVDSYVFTVTGATVGFSVAATNSEGLAARLYKPATLHNPYHIIVAGDGSGTHTTIKAAFAAIPSNSNNPTVVFIKNGVYREWLILESSKKNVILVGEHVDSAIITYNAAAPDPYPADGSAPKSASGSTIGTMGSATLHVEAENFYAENLTIQNTAGISAGQAVALRTTKDKQVFVGCKLKGFQDTHYTHGDGRQYYKSCYIEGTVDFIFGNAAAYFDGCILYCLARSSGEVTAAATPAGKYGYVFNNCRIEGNAAAGTFSLGRPWKDNCHVVFMNTYMSSVIKAKGWGTWDTKTYKYYEYNNSGEGAGNPSVRGNNATDPGTFKYLTDDEAADYTLEKVMRQQPNAAQTVDNWHPNQLISRAESILRQCAIPASF